MSWASLFWTAFKRSHNAMAVIDERRRCVEVNGAFLRATGYAREAVIGRPTWELVQGGPRLSEREWRTALVGGEVFGEADLVAADGGTLSVHYAAHPEVVTGRRLVLFVLMDTTRRGRLRRSDATEQSGDKLSDREREVVNLVALGHTSREIGDQLHIAHNTVRTHVRNAQDKLGARSRAQLVAIALGDGHAAAASS
jgi:PAS domain S-box-containing protein